MLRADNADNADNAKNTEWLGIMQVVAAGICWGTLGIFSTQLGKLGFSSMQIGTLRIATAGILMMVLLPSLLPIFRQLSAREWLSLSLQSLVGVLGMTLCYFFAVQQVGVSMAVALLYTAPVFSLIFAKIILGETVSAKSVFLAVVAELGLLRPVKKNAIAVCEQGLLLPVLWQLKSKWAHYFRE